MRIRYPALLAVLLFAAPARAGGINLSWNDCGSAGLSLATFACNSNSGANHLFASFVSPVPMTQLIGIELVMDVEFNQPTVPSWWMMTSPGGCRPNSLVGNVNFLGGPFTCADPWAGVAAQGVITQPGVPFANRVRVRALAAVPQNLPMVVNDVSEYYGFEFILGHQKTVGGACVGCADPACMLLTSIKLVQPAGVGDYLITAPLSDQLVGWQCPAFNGAPTPQCFFCPVPAGSKSWGTLKGLYR